MGFDDGVDRGETDPWETRKNILLNYLLCKSYLFLALFGVYFFAIDFLFHYKSVHVIL